jgi:hypothetical protein
MKKLVLFENYNPGDNRGESLSDEIAAQLIKEKCDFEKALEYPIYRGIPTGLSNIRLVDPSKYKRVSRNTHNYYTMIVDNSGKWKGFPMRSKSLICSTSTKKTSGYGDTYLMVPYKDAKIGICPKDDFWFSFDRIKSITGGINASDIMDLMEELIDLFRMEPPEDYYDLRQTMEYCEEQLNSEEGMDDFLTVVRDRNKRTVMEYYLTHKSSNFSTFSKHNDKSLMGFFEWLFEPEGFSIKEYKDYKVKDNGGDYGQEVWTDSPCVMINITKMPMTSAAFLHLKKSIL